MLRLYVYISTDWKKVCTAQSNNLERVFRVRMSARRAIVFLLLRPSETRGFASFYDFWFAAETWLITLFPVFP